MSDYPVMFTLRDAVSGNDFLAGVTLSGRAVMCQEKDGKWWIYGVRPGAIAETGNTPAEAFLRFRSTYKNVLFDLAEESRTFESFKTAVEAFYSQPDEQEEERWESAFRAMRSGTLVPKDAFFANLPRHAPETRPTQLTVDRLDQKSARYKPTDNVPDLFALPATAAA